MLEYVSLNMATTLKKVQGAQLNGAAQQIDIKTLIRDGKIPKSKINIIYGFKSVQDKIFALSSVYSLTLAVLETINDLDSSLLLQKFIAKNNAEADYITLFTNFLQNLNLKGKDSNLAIQTSIFEQLMYRSCLPVTTNPTEAAIKKMPLIPSNKLLEAKFILSHNTFPVKFDYEMQSFWVTFVYKNLLKFPEKIDEYLVISSNSIGRNLRSVDMGEFLFLKTIEKNQNPFSLKEIQNSLIDYGIDVSDELERAISLSYIGDVSL